MDRVIVGLCAILMRPTRLLRSAIVEMKRRNASYGYQRIANLILKSHWVMVVMDQFTRRIIDFAVHAGVLDGLTVCRMFISTVARLGDYRWKERCRRLYQQPEAA